MLRAQSVKESSQISELSGIMREKRVPILPYTQPKTAKGHFRPWEYKYDAVTDTLTCPHGKTLRYTTTDRDGKRTCRSTPSGCRNCPRREECGANEKGQKMVQRHIWPEYLDLVEQLCKTERGKALYAKRKDSIERVFGDAKEKHAMRYTHHRGLARVTNWVTLKFACMNLKKLASWSWNGSAFCLRAGDRRFRICPALPKGRARISRLYPHR